jgi:amidase
MTTHLFQPTRYYSTIGSHEPALTVADGDTVIAQTIDAFGQDINNTVVAPRGNPMSGPIFVQGAEPGDMLAFRIDRITPNREIGYTRTTLAYQVVDADFVPQLGPRTDMAQWRVDTVANTATLIQPGTKLGNFSMPLDPMIGCFGIAPAKGAAIPTATSAENGGNMDYRGFKAGATVYFPVAVPGALVFLGDVHALQGDGEIVGTGIEISATVEFTVRAIKGKKITWPRGENADYIFTAGNARPLDQALQHATTEMARWLAEDYGLDINGLSMFMGMAVEYEVGNVYNPAYTMICKLPKRLLPKNK